jgi:hypothetical protein
VPERVSLPSVRDCDDLGALTDKVHDCDELVPPVIYVIDDDGAFIETVPVPNDNTPFASTEQVLRKVVLPVSVALVTTVLLEDERAVITFDGRLALKLYETLVTTLVATVAAVTTALSAVANDTLCE